MHIHRNKGQINTSLPSSHEIPERIPCTIQSLVIRIHLKLIERILLNEVLGDFIKYRLIGTDFSKKIEKTLVSIYIHIYIFLITEFGGS